MALTYTLTYTPDNSKANPGEINFLCSDKKLHVRLRDYNKYQTIAGFEQKLRYLVTYLINFSSSVNLYDAKKLAHEASLIEFSKSAEAKIICNCVAKGCGQKVRGIKVSLNYKKSGDDLLGMIDPEAFPIIRHKEETSRSTYSGNLNAFLYLLGLTLEAYLFDDRYKIIIHQREKNLEKINKKFLNKQIKKYDKAAADYEQLW